MKKFFKKFGETILLIGFAVMYAVYVTICAEHGFQTYPWYGVMFGVLSFVWMSSALIGLNYLIDQLQKERQKNK